MKTLKVNDNFLNSAFDNEWRVFMNVFRKKGFEELIYTESLWLFMEDEEDVPNNLRVEGDLAISGNITHLPQRMHITGDLDIADAVINQPLSNVYIGRDLLVVRSPLREITDDVIIKGNIYISNPELILIPDNLKNKIISTQDAINTLNKW